MISKSRSSPPSYEHGAPNAVWEIQGYCRSIITLDDFLFANQDVLLGRVELHETLRESGRSAQPRATLSPSCRLYGSVVIGEGVSLGKTWWCWDPAPSAPDAPLSRAR